MSQWPRAILFDLDGTLVDSLPDIAGAVNDLMRAHGLQPHTPDAVARMIGKGVANLVQTAFAAHNIPLSGPALDAAVREYLGIYEPRATRDTRPFAPVPALLRSLQARGIRLAVCTNKPTAISVAMIAEFGLAGLLPVVVGGDFGPARKPAPDMLFKCAELLGVAPVDCLMVGDSAADVMAGKAAGMVVIAVDTGYSATPIADLGADLVLPTLDDFEAAMDRLARA